MVIEYCDGRVSFAEAGRTVAVYRSEGIHEEYTLSVDGTDLVIDSTLTKNSARYETHGCALNFQYVIVPMSVPSESVVFIYALRDL